MSVLELIGVLLGGAGFLTALITALRSPAAILSYAQANKISAEQISGLEAKIKQQKEDFENEMRKEKEACREKINVLAGVIADLIQDRTISKANKQKLNEKLSLITDPPERK